MSSGPRLHVNVTPLTCNHTRNVGVWIVKVRFVTSNDLSLTTKSIYFAELKCLLISTCVIHHWWAPNCTCNWTAQHTFKLPLTGQGEGTVQYGKGVKIHNEGGVKDYRIIHCIVSWNKPSAVAAGSGHCRIALPHKIQIQSQDKQNIYR